MTDEAPKHVNEMTVLELEDFERRHGIRSTANPADLDKARTEKFRDFERQHGIQPARKGWG